jgi:hypothetical protein
VRAKDYAGPLGVLAAGVIGFSLLCSVSALAMNDLSSQVHVTLEPINLMDLAVANLSTSAALTHQAVTAFVSTPTLVPTATASLTPLPSNTAVIPVSFTPRQPTRTRRPPEETAGGSVPIQPTNPRPTSTNPPLPTATRTLLPPPTDTPLPAPTNTQPPPTDTPLPAPTDTQPAPTDVPPPAPTDTTAPPTALPVNVANPTATPSP